MINVIVDDDVLEEKINKKIEDKIQEFGVEKIFYSMENLVEITSFSIGHIKNTFFDDKRFKKIRRRVGRKWVFPVEQTNIFLKEWILEQPND